MCRKAKERLKDNRHATENHNQNNLHNRETKTKIAQTKETNKQSIELIKNHTCTKQLTH